MRLAGLLGALALLVAARALAGADVPAPTEPGAALRAATLPPCTYKTDEWTPVGGLQAPLAAGRYDEVEGVLLDFHRSFEQNHACENRMLRSFLEGFYGTSEELREHFDRWVAARPKSWMAYSLRGLYWVDEAYRRRGAGLGRDLTDEQSQGLRDGARLAIRDLERAIELRPSAVVAHGGLMRAHKALGDIDEVERVWRRAIEIDPLSVHLHELAAIGFEPWWGGDLEQVAAVVAHARRHVKENPRLIRAYGHRDLCEARLIGFGGKPPPEAVARQLALYNSALRYGETNSAWHSWRAHTYIENGFYDYALEDAAWALAADPKATNFWVIRIRALMGANRLDEALAATHAAQKEIDHHWFLWYEGGTLRRMGRHAEAAARLRAAADHAGVSPKTRGTYLTDLGEVLVLAERPAEAEAPLREAVALRPDYAPAWLALGDALWDLDRRADAKPALRKYLALTRGDPTAAATRAHVARELAGTR